MKFGIIGALSAEIKIIKNRMKMVATETHFGATYYLGSYENQEIVLVECGVGKIVAAVCAHTMAKHYKVDYLINTGVAGALDKRLKVLDVVVGREVLFHDIDHNLYKKYFPYETIFYAEDKLGDIAIKVLEETEEIDYYQGRIATGDEFVNSNQLKAKITENFAPLCVEMEGAAIAQVAFMNKTPFLIIRTMSDSADDEAEESYDNLFDKAGEISAKIVLGMLEVIEEKIFTNNTIS